MSIKLKKKHIWPFTMRNQAQWNPQQYAKADADLGQILLVTLGTPVGWDTCITGNIFSALHSCIDHSFTLKFAVCSSADESQTSSIVFGIPRQMLWEWFRFFSKWYLNSGDLDSQITIACNTKELLEEMVNCTSLPHLRFGFVREAYCWTKKIYYLRGYFSSFML